MINNRQGGRRRGRGGGPRGPNLGGQPGNRQDNRQRGNAAQLLEKYKNLARDSQLAGDRVQTEYYLQYADHYFRVLGENRSRCAATVRAAAIAIAATSAAAFPARTAATTKSRISRSRQ